MDEASDATDMSNALTARVALSFTIRAALIAVTCLVLGLWGLWDYVVEIPQQERYFARANVSRAFLAAGEGLLEPGSRPEAGTWTKFSSSLVDDLELEAGDQVRTEIEATRSAVESLDPSAVPKLEQLLVEKVLPGIADQDHTGDSRRMRGLWMVAAKEMVSAAAAQTTSSQEDRVAQLKLGIFAARRELELYGEVEQPSAYDRPVQWMFILSLPFVPYYVWVLIRHCPRRYRLDSDGTLHLPGATWPRGEIDDIDMSRWMKTSKAWVVHTDGCRVLLDDYVYKNICRIVGALAAELHPDEWTGEAKPVKTRPADEDSGDAAT